MAKPWDYYRKAKSISMGRVRTYRSIKAVAIHWTEAGPNDTAKNQADYFATGNNRPAGAHFFVDRYGMVSLSVPVRRVGWSVMSSGYLPGPYYGIYDNTNTVSIELCGLEISEKPGYRFPTDAQLRAVKKVIEWLAIKCPNCKDVIRHYDVKKKPCPLPYVKEPDKWEELRNELRGLLNG